MIVLIVKCVVFVDILRELRDKFKRSQKVVLTQSSFKRPKLFFNEDAKTLGTGVHIGASEPLTDSKNVHIGLSESLIDVRIGIPPRAANAHWMQNNEVYSE